MKASNNLIDYIRTTEGYHDKPYISDYEDCVGYGHRGKTKHESLSEEEAYQLLLNDINRIEKYLNILKVEWTQNQFDACVDFIYCLGLDAFMRSVLRRNIVTKKKIDHKCFTGWHYVYDGEKFLSSEKKVARRAWEWARWSGEI